MRIREICVRNLFGIFNHTVTMKLDERITIIHGKNGVGKTALLTIINALLSLNFYELSKIYFDDFKIEFDDCSYVRVNQINQVDNNIRSNKNFVLNYKKQNWSEEKHFETKVLDVNTLDFPLSIIEIPQLERISLRAWVNLETNEILTLEDVFENFGNILPITSNYIRKPDWLQELKDSINIRFIQSQRLLDLSPYIINSKLEQQPPMMLSVAAYAHELSGLIKAKLAEYGSLSQSLDKSFPIRLVQQKNAKSLTFEELRQKLSILEEKRSHLISAGLLEKDNYPDFEVQEQIDDNTKQVLSIYIDDVDKKLSLFEDLAERIDIFKGIINQRFSYKQLNINKEKGFVFNRNGSSLSPDNLSSGEQHELIMLYELLFKAKPNALILIDEPELSLHVEWQVQFLRDLQKITKVSELDVLLATHSPDLIHDRWDLTVELKGV